MSSSSIYKVALLIFALALTKYAHAQDRSDPYFIPEDKVISYTKDVQPIFREKCMACHACFDSPAQLNLTNEFGVRRGAAKIDAYDLRPKAAPFFKLEQTDKSIEQFRDIGFFSVLEGGKDSLLGRMIKLGYEHQWKPNEPIPPHIQIDSLTHRLTAPTSKEFIGYENAHPRQGMPFAIAGLTANEYATIMKWLEQGSQFDGTPPKATATEQAKIKEWEAFLNGEDLKSQLIGRYVYEHIYTFHAYFDQDSPNFFAMVRSSTPPGEPVKPISTRFANEEVKGKYWYRFSPVDVILHHKRHAPMNCCGDKLQRCKDELLAIPFEVDELPGYSVEERLNPMLTFAAIPAKSRYRFLLLDADLHGDRVTEIGASCRGSLNVSTAAEHMWYVFENPETSLICTDQEYLDAAAPLMGQVQPIHGFREAISALKDITDRLTKMREIEVTKLKQNPRASLDDIWTGGRPGDVPGFTVDRNDDNSCQYIGLHGPLPDRVMVMNLVIIERRIYCASTNFDIFSDAGMMLSWREEFGNARLAGELNYLRFLPKDKRLDQLAKLYKGGIKDKRIRENLPEDLDIPSEIDFKTDDCHQEFMQMLVEHLKDAVPTNDAIHRPQAGDTPDEVTKAFQMIARKSDELYQQADPGFKRFLDEATVVRVDHEGKEPDFYTMSVAWDNSKLDYVGNVLLRPSVKYDRVYIFDAVLTSYPNFMFHLKASEMNQFATSICAADDEAKFLAVVDRWGVRRTNPNSWEVFHSIEDFVRRKTPRYAAVFDVNRYIDYSPGNMPKKMLVDPRLIPGKTGVIRK